MGDKRKMNKNKLIELRCKAWGITEDEYYCNQCSDFSLEDMARAYRRGKNKGRADLEKENAELKERIAELEEKISILLSCKNCPENKGGYICEKEYEDKCLAQKIQYIKELKEENAELKKQVEQKQHLADVRLEQSLENYKLFADERKARIDVDIALDATTDQLSYAKTIIQDLLENTDESARQRAEDFLKENK